MHGRIRSAAHGTVLLTGRAGFCVHFRFVRSPITMSARPVWCRGWCACAFAEYIGLAELLVE
jgi:hypothetical protein